MKCAICKHILEQTHDYVVAEATVFGQSRYLSIRSFCYVRQAKAQEDWKEKYFPTRRAAQ